MLPSQDSKDSGEEEGGTYPARDVRYTAHGGKVCQGDVEKCKQRGCDVCEVCYGICCGAARELVANLCKMRAIGITNKVIW